MVYENKINSFIHLNSLSTKKTEHDVGNPGPGSKSIVLSVLIRVTTSDYPFGIFIFYLLHTSFYFQSSNLASSFYFQTFYFQSSNLAPSFYFQSSNLASSFYFQSSNLASSFYFQSSNLPSSFYFQSSNLASFFYFQISNLSLSFYFQSSNLASSSIVPLLIAPLQQIAKYSLLIKVNTHYSLRFVIKTIIFLKDVCKTSDVCTVKSV